MEMTLAIILLCAKLVADAAQGHRALKEVKLLREEVSLFREAVVVRLDNHEVRIDDLEKNKDAA